MSITAANCHYYFADEVPSTPAAPNVVSIFAWVKIDANGGPAGRSIIDLDSGDDWGVERRRLGMRISGANEIRNRYQPAFASIGTVDNNAGGALFFYDSPNQNKWTAAGVWIDGTAGTNEAGTIVGRSVATAIPANQVLGGAISDLAAGVFLKDFHVLRNGTVLEQSGTDSSSSSIRLAHLAIWYGYRLTTSDFQLLIDGTNPQDIGVGAARRHYFPLRTAAGDGLTDIINGVVLVPTGGAAAAAWQDADNPTVNPASGAGPSTGAPPFNRRFNPALLHF